MLGKFWESVGGKLADRWAAVAAPAVLFWAGGLLAWAFAGSGWERLSEITDWLNDQEVASQIAALLGALAGVVGSAVLVQRLTTPTMRLLEGYWPAWAGGLAKRLRDRALTHAEADDCHWQRLQVEMQQTAHDLSDLESIGRRFEQDSVGGPRLVSGNPKVVAEELSAVTGINHSLKVKDAADQPLHHEVREMIRLKVDERAQQLGELARLEQRRQRRPSRPERLLPTRVGNIMRAAETHPYDHYGLEAVIVWPRLWLVIPEIARLELSSARASLDSSVAAAIWGLGFCAFVPLAWWAAPVGVVVAASAWHWWVPNRAETFADLVETTYDLYRSELYEQLRWPLPSTPADEQQAGKLLTRYLLRGSEAGEPRFTGPTSTP